MIARAPTRSRLNGQTRAAPPLVRVAIYTRKSVDKGDGGEFGSIEAQRAAVEGYIASQREQGWVALPTGYDDLGESGATTNRPAFQRLLSDLSDGKVDLVAVYRLDRLSRSQRDFLGLMDFLDEHGVTFVSVTERFDTTTPMGRFALGITIQVAQLERETTALRVKDKVLASRRRGLWTGGFPPLGYDVVDRQLVVNESEANQVRWIFAAYLDLGSLRQVVEQLDHRGWTTKSWTTVGGTLKVGRPWTKNALRNLLSSPIPVGRTAAEGEHHDGQHDAIVEQGIWDAVQAQLAAHRPETRPERPRSKTGALLQGLLTCGRCEAAMGPHSTRRHGRLYVSYVCQTIQKRGAAACPGSRAASHEVDGFVVSQLRALGADAELQAATVAAAREQQGARQAELRVAIADAKGDLRRLDAERATFRDHSGPDVVRRLAEIDAAHQRASDGLAVAQREARALRGARLREADLRAALGAFVPVWEVLFPAERARVLHLLIEAITYDAAGGTLAITYRPGGIRTLAEEARG